MERNTLLPNLSPGPKFCAQRLTASWRETPGRGQGGAHGHGGCSTPYGIMERNTRCWPCRPRSGSVLNALRHHGEKHDHLGVSCTAKDGVLNALRHHGEKHSWSPRLL